MSKIGIELNRLYPIILFFFSLLLLYFGFIYFNQNYWLQFLQSRSNLPQKYRLLLWLTKIFIIILLVSLIIFRKLIIAKKKEIFLSLSTLVIILSLLEISSRIYICNFGSSSLQKHVLFYGQCGKKSLYSPHHYLNYFGTPNYQSSDKLNIHNSLGFRGPEIDVPKPKSVYRIAVLGGSTVYTLAVQDWRQDFPRQLEKQLRQKYNYPKIEVINAGLGGWESWESLINLEFKLLDLEPDLLIICDGLNDVHSRLVNPDYYKPDNSGRRKQWSERPIPFFFHSTLLRWITGINPSMTIDYFVVASTSAGLTEEIGYINAIGGTPLEVLQKNKPIFFERNIRNMLAIAKEYGIKVLLVTGPLSDQIHDYSITQHYQIGMKENNELIQKIGKNHNIPVFDLATEMPKDKQYWADGRHVNERGAQLEAKLFTEYIFETGIISEVETLK